MVFITEKEFKKLKKCRNSRQIKKYRKEESCLIKACLEYLQLAGFIAIRNNTGLIVLKEENGSRAVKMGFRGASDIIACGPDGRFVAIECKTPKGKLTDAQRDFLESVKSRGGHALIVRSTDELIKKLEVLYERNNLYSKKR